VRQELDVGSNQWTFECVLSAGVCFTVSHALPVRRLQFSEQPLSVLKREKKKSSSDI